MNSQTQVPVLAVQASKLSNILNRSVQHGTYEKFSIRVKNNCITTQKVAILPAYFDTVNYDTSRGPVGSLGSVEELNKNGFTVAATAFDGSKTITGGGGGTTDATIDFQSGNPSASINSFFKYIRTNPRQLKSMLIVSNNQDAFSSSLELTKANPMGNGKLVPIDINQFFSPDQYQPDRVIIDFSDYPLEICDDLMMAVNIPAGSTLEFSFRF